MSDPFDETLIASAPAFFLLPGAEYLTYFPAAGSSRRIQAIVSRPGPEQLAGVSGGSSPAIEVLVMNDASSGISSATIDTGGDRLEIAAHVGEKPVRMRIVEIINHDAGHLLLKVR